MEIVKHFFYYSSRPSRLPDSPTVSLEPFSAHLVNKGPGSEDDVNFQLPRDSSISLELLCYHTITESV